MSSILSVGGAGNVGGGSFYPYSIDQSLRFNDDDSAYLNRTPASAGNRKTWTWSGWVKLGAVGVQSIPISAYQDGSNFTRILFASGNVGAIKLQNTISNTSVGDVATNALFRDPSSWYHIVIAVDTTQATASDRAKIYVNGVDQSLTTNTAFTLNSNTFLNNTTAQYIGAQFSGNSHFDGYLAEVHLIDGTALDATSFGEAINGVWVPKRYSGSYGANGFYLPFDDSSAIGDDESGNTNDWTANNLAASDVVPDSPTNNFATWNVLASNYVSDSATPTFSDGNLKVVTGTTTRTNQVATIGFNSGKWYWEIDKDDSTATLSLGIGSILPFSSGDQTTVASSASGVWRVAVDFDAGKLWVTQSTSNTDIEAGTNPSTTFSYDDVVFPLFRDFNNSLSTTFTTNFGQSGFTYTPPTDYLALSTANLPEPTISPNAAEQADDYFNTVLYTGNGSTQSITGVGHQPDFVWIKDRTTTGLGNVLFDSVRGAGKYLFSSDTDAEGSGSGILDSFDADGFTLGSNGHVNASSDAYVSWNWKAGGTAVSNTDGSITSQVSAAPDAGFSIVSWAGNSTNGATIGHGLGKVPNMIIAKARDVAQNWIVYRPEIGNSNVLLLNATSAAFADGAWNSTTPTSSVFTVNNGQGINESPYNYIAYCFADVDGFSKAGSYTGNGSTDGTFVYTGFRPAWVMLKRTDASNDWPIQDSVRNDFNAVDKTLYADLSNSESDLDRMDFLSNGFKLRNTYAENNASGGTYIFLAFAEAPFKYANAR